MGCLGSRDSQRQGLFESQHWNLPFAFRKADKKNAAALGPYNALAMGFLSGKDHEDSALGKCDDLKFTPEKKDALLGEAKKIFELLKSSHKYAESFSDDKETGWMGFMKPSDAAKELDAALK